jgi:hypothetical protein
MRTFGTNPMLSALARRFAVMAGIVPAIHVFLFCDLKTWMPGTRPGMTSQATALGISAP